jgi:hypothetical protein
MSIYCVKAKKVGTKRWAFLTSEGGTNHLRIHAAQILTKERAEQIAGEIAQENAGTWEAKVEVLYVY